MSKLVTSIAGFVLLCGLIFFALRDRKAPEATPPDRVLELIRATSDDLGRVEDALERTNYGEAERELWRLRARLGEMKQYYVARDLPGSGLAESTREARGP